MAKKNNNVTLNIKVGKKVRHMEFEMLRNLGSNRYILYKRGKLSLGKRLSSGLWSIDHIADVDYNFVEENMEMCTP